jgi:hypothetical protein
LAALIRQEVAEQRRLRLVSLLVTAHAPLEAIVVERHVRIDHATALVDAAELHRAERHLAEDLNEDLLAVGLVRHRVEEVADVQSGDAPRVAVGHLRRERLREGEARDHQVRLLGVLESASRLRDVVGCRRQSLRAALRRERGRLFFSHV